VVRVAEVVRPVGMMARDRILPKGEAVGLVRIHGIWMLFLWKGWKGFHRV
jgi:hypothetical protein